MRNSVSVEMRCPASVRLYEVVTLPLMARREHFRRIDEASNRSCDRGVPQMSDYGRPATQCEGHGLSGCERMAFVQLERMVLEEESRAVAMATMTMSLLG